MIVIVTGGSSGIGKACVERLGAGAVGPPRSECDLLRPESIRSFVGQVGEFDAIVHCAYSYEEPERVGRKALETLWLCGSPMLRERGGALVVLSSVAVPRGDRTAYAEDKRAQERMAMGYARDGAPDVRVNIVRAHLISGTRAHPVEDPKRAAEVPLRRYGRPEEVAEAVWLAVTCRHMTGSVVTVDGGHSIGQH